MKLFERQVRNPALRCLFLYTLSVLALLAIHFPLLNLPYFWDEHGQFIPTALDLLRDGAWVAHSTLPNVHPPGVEAYLVLWYKVFGYSIPITRIAMLFLAALGVLAAYLLARELSRVLSDVQILSRLGSKMHDLRAERRTPVSCPLNAAPALLAAALLMASPLFYTQSMMAQLDMPAMVFTCLALLCFLRGGHMAGAFACTLLVLSKETGVITPAVFFVALWYRRERKQALFYLAAPLALSLWLLVLYRTTGNWLGNPEFAHYNVGYSLEPVRIAITILRRVYYLFFGEFRWIGTFVLVLSLRRAVFWRSPEWKITGAVFAANAILVSVFGGAALERYLLPALPLFYIAVAFALYELAQPKRALLAAVLLAGLAGCLFWNPPYPFPFENNLAMVDFVRLQQDAGRLIEEQYPQKTVATAWPYTKGLQRPEYGFVTRPVRTVETTDFHLESIRRIPPEKYDVLVTYTRTWAPATGVIAIPTVIDFLKRYYTFAFDIDDEQCESLGLRRVASWERHGQQITVYAR